jgi:hypothetical protein
MRIARARDSGCRQADSQYLRHSDQTLAMEQRSETVKPLEGKDSPEDAPQPCLT